MLEAIILRTAVSEVEGSARPWRSAGVSGASTRNSRPLHMLVSSLARTQDRSHSQRVWKDDWVLMATSSYPGSPSLGELGSDRFCIQGYPGAGPIQHPRPSVSDAELDPSAVHSEMSQYYDKGLGTRPRKESEQFTGAAGPWWSARWRRSSAGCRTQTSWGIMPGLGG